MSTYFSPPLEPVNRFPGLDGAAELLLRLSVFGFSRLSVADQQQKTEEIRDKVVEDVTIVDQLPEESEQDFRVRTFTQLFKKLPFPEKNLCLSTIIKKFERQRKFGGLVFMFKKLDAKGQTEMIRTLMKVDVEADDETSEDFRLRRFTELCRVYTGYVYKMLSLKYPWHSEERMYELKKDDDELSSDWWSRFAEFFLGFSIIWFNGQNADGQSRMLNSYSKVCGGKTHISQKPYDESEDDWRLRRFTELCKKVVHLGSQMRFLEDAAMQLCHRTTLPHGVLLQPQDSASAAELLLHLSTFGFSLLSPNEQQCKIEKIASHGIQETERLAEETEEEFRMRTFRELFHKAPLSTRSGLFKEMTEKFFGERRVCDSIRLFRQLGSNDQENLIESLFDRSEKMYDAIIEKFQDESEDDFRLRRFIRLCTAFPFLWDDSSRLEAEKCVRKGALLHPSGNVEIHEINQYAEFFSGMSIIWFKARCANHPRNPIQVLIGLVGGGDHVIEKLPNENNEDFRLKRFNESFQQLPFSSQEYILNYIQSTVLYDLVSEEKKDWCGHFDKWEFQSDFDGYNLFSSFDEASVNPMYDGDDMNIYSNLGSPIQRRQSFDPNESTEFRHGFIKVKTLNLIRGGATTQAGGSTTHGGGGMQGTRQQ